MEIEIVCSSFSNNSKLWEELIKSYEIYAASLLDKFKFTIITDLDNNFNNQSKVNLFCLNKDYGWSFNLIKYLQITNSEYIFVIFDDVFLKSKINVDLFDQIVKDYMSNQMTFCRFRNSPLTLKRKFNSVFNSVDIDSPYRTVLSYSLVKRDILLSLLEEDENAWEYEYNSPKRSLKLNVYETNLDPFDYIHVIEKGGYRFPCLFLRQFKSIREHYDLFIPNPLYVLKIIFGYVFSVLPYFFKRLIYAKLSKLTYYEDYSSGDRI